MKTNKQQLRDALQQKIDLKTKPQGSLGQLEEIALQVGLIQQTLTPTLSKPHIVVFAGDHGITAEGVSPFPQEVTYQMVFNFLQGGAAINVFSKQHEIALKVVDAGVNYDFESTSNLIHAKIGYGTNNFLYEPAMTNDECQQALKKGEQIVEELHLEGCNVIGFGEMGIGNTSAAAVLMSILTGLSIEECVGAGTGLDQEGIQHKIDVLKKSIHQHTIPKAPLDILALFGGYEIAMMTGAFLKAATLDMTILVDGFIVTAALLVAARHQPSVVDNCIFTHTSNEKGHQKMLDSLDAKPVLDISMRLGEGTGVAVAYPLIQSAVCFLNEMASFESAGVSTSDEVHA